MLPNDERLELPDKKPDGSHAAAHGSVQLELARWDVLATLSNLDRYRCGSAELHVHFGISGYRNRHFEVDLCAVSQELIRADIARGTDDRFRGRGDGHQRFFKTTPDGDQLAVLVGVFEATNDGKNGIELWKSDGTSAGTRMVKDLFPGKDAHGRPNSSVYGKLNRHVPAPYAVLDGRIYFPANDGKKGLELWSFDNGATAQPIGRGCGEPEPRMSADDPILGTTITVRGDNALNPAIAISLLGLKGSAPRTLFGCENHLNLLQPWLLLNASSNTQSSWSFPFRIPNLPALNGITLASQTWYLIPKQAASTRSTNGLLLTFGRR